ncbi:50S ribosomal protein L25 [Enterobacteriaceae endosymbiont of Plateumaris braccata]|uniref:50S ribosomal protein L25 n=1 Tax=Enterobacteriaceae endosymbiont of Plateumaris braccata TaxID=2675793 RepID=UPI00144923FF|nr:50S ribosomal protein L25 [Enterobacteriaceae endosymbiont of Plateumaris braccata]QJC28030.1 50S ribosomal protein L25 [Enterobacteriaceae endosymbiont of Plateumaris braccata]
MNKIKIFKRNITGKKSNKWLRINGKIPAIIYGNKKKEISIFIKNKDLLNINNNLLSNKYHILQLIDEKNKLIRVKISDIQYHPYQLTKIYHIDFLRL